MNGLAFNRAFAMPSADTFNVRPIAKFVQGYLEQSAVSVDPFARNNRWATYTNDLDPETAAEHHMDAGEFLRMLGQRGVSCDMGIFDPPYSPRQIAECYKAIGRKVRTADTQNARLYKSVRDAMDKLIMPGGVVLSFGWQSSGMGVSRGYELIDILLVSHGGAHNDTICIAERKAIP